MNLNLYRDLMIFQERSLKYIFGFLGIPPIQIDFFWVHIKLGSIEKHFLFQTDFFLNCIKKRNFFSPETIDIKHFYQKQQATVQF